MLELNQAVWRTQPNTTQHNTMSAATEVAGKPFAHNNS
jgi:hypothetical protein